MARLSVVIVVMRAPMTVRSESVAINIGVSKSITMYHLTEEFRK